MNLRHIHFLSACILSSSLFLTACGGGGGSDTNTSAPLLPTFTTPGSSSPAEGVPTSPSGPSSNEAPAGWVAPQGITGSVRNILNTTNLEGVTVEVYDSATYPAPSSGLRSTLSASGSAPLYSVRTDVNGQFHITEIRLQGYPIFRFYLENYLDTIFHYNQPAPDVADSSPLQLEPTRLPTTEEVNGKADIAGTIKDALTGRVIPNATVKLYRNGNTTLEANYSLLTDSDGKYSKGEVDAGTYVAVISATGYITTSRNSLYAYIGPTSDYSTQNQNLNFTLTPVLNEDEWRIVLTWGEHPSDLDSHIWAPSISSTKENCAATSGWEADKHIYYSYKRDSENSVNLDVDDVTSYGPETITISDQQEGVYYYSIHHYSGQKSIAESGAKIELYKGSELKRTFYAPTVGGEGMRVWDVFSLNGNTITTENSYRTSSGVPSCPSGNASSVSSGE